MTEAALAGKITAAAARITSGGFRHGRAIYDTLPDLRQDVADIAAAANDPDEPGPGLQALFAGIIEPWSDSFQPLARDAYGVVFSDIVWRTAHGDPALMQALHAADIHGPEDMEAGWQRRRDSSLPWPTSPQENCHFIAGDAGR